MSRALAPAEAEIVAGLDVSLQSIALHHRELALDRGLPFVFISGLRSRSQQAALANDPTRATPAAASGNSKHEVGAAYDVARQSPAIEATVGALGESLGLRWGGAFKPTPDPNHFELPQSRTDIASYRNLMIFGLAAGLGLVVLVTTEHG